MKVIYLVLDLSKAKIQLFFMMAAMSSTILTPNLNPNMSTWGWGVPYDQIIDGGKDGV